MDATPMEKLHMHAMGAIDVHERNVVYFENTLTYRDKNKILYAFASLGIQTAINANRAKAATQLMTLIKDLDKSQPVPDNVKDDIVKEISKAFPMTSTQEEKAQISFWWGAYLIVR